MRVFLIPMVGHRSVPSSGESTVTASRSRFAQHYRKVVFNVLAVLRENCSVIVVCLRRFFCFLLLFPLDFLLSISPRTFLLLDRIFRLSSLFRSDTV